MMLFSFLTPWTALIAAGITVPILVSMYFLRLRRKQVVVSSTLLWKKAIRDLQVNSPFQWIRLDSLLMLLLQLAILAALLLAMGRPMFRSTMAAEGQRVVIVIDQSASMNATDVKPTRLAVAKDTALDLVDKYGGGGGGGGGGIMVIAIGHHAKVLQPFTTDKELLKRKIREIQPTDNETLLGPALAQIEPFTDVSSKDRTSKPVLVYVISDGRITDGKELSLPGGHVRALPIGNPDVENLAIVSISARRDPDRPTRVQVFANLMNYGPTPVTTGVTMSLDGQTVANEKVTIPGVSGPKHKPGGQAVSFERTIPDAALITIEHDHEDALSADNSASVALMAAQQPHVLLVTDGNTFLQRAIESTGVKKLEIMAPRKYEIQDPQRLHRGGPDRDSGFDAIVFDGYSPKQLPPVNSLYLGGVPPIPNLSLLSWKKDDPENRQQRLLNWDRNHPLLRNVMLDGVVFEEEGRLSLPDTANVLAVGAFGPMMAEVRHEGVYHVMTSFEVLKSNWPISVSFMVFMENAVPLLALGGEDAGRCFQTGTAEELVVGDVNQVVYDGPTTLTAKVENGRTVLPMFERVGVYRARGAVPAPNDVLAVNLMNAVESDLRPVEVLPVAAESVQTVSRKVAVLAEVWRWMIWAGLALLLTEWVIYTLRMRV